jgi:hypothetical protein
MPEESELERRKVTVFIQRPNSKKLAIKPKDDKFVLVDAETGEEIAVSKSDHALSNWAFSCTGAFEIAHCYDLSKGDMSR